MQARKNAPVILKPLDVFETNDFDGVEDLAMLDMKGRLGGEGLEPWLLVADLFRRASGHLRWPLVGFPSTIESLGFESAVALVSLNILVERGGAPDNLKLSFEGEDAIVRDDDCDTFMLPQDRLVQPHSGSLLSSARFPTSARRSRVAASSSSFPSPMLRWPVPHPRSCARRSFSTPTATSAPTRTSPGAKCAPASPTGLPLGMRPHDLLGGATYNDVAATHIVGATCTGAATHIGAATYIGGATPVRLHNSAGLLTPVRLHQVRRPSRRTHEAAHVRRDCDGTAGEHMENNAC